MRTVLYINGIALLGLALFMLLPLILEINEHTQDWQVFAISTFFCLFFGALLVFANQSEHYELDVRHAYVLTITIWLIISLFGALPFYFSHTGYKLSFTDAIFETVSGITTTSSTVYVGLDQAPKGILLWRSLLQFIGGIGIVVMSMTILPYLKVGGMQIFRLDASEYGDKILLSIRQITIYAILLYFILNIVCAYCYYIAGMSVFDAVNHAMTTISTGGFSTHDASFGYFNNKVRWVGVIFMIIGATPLMLYYYPMIGRVPSRPLLEQTKAFLFGLLTVIMVMTLWLIFHVGMNFIQALNQAVFNITSIATTSGFVSEDYSKWGSFPMLVFYFLIVMGGCTGSTCGGIKTFRVQVMVKVLLLEIKRMVHPHGVFSTQLGGKTLDTEVTKSVGTFFLIFIFTFLVTAIGLSFTGLDFITSVSGAAEAISNVGSGLGSIIGPTHNFSSLPNSSIWILTLAMLVGRLEIITVLVLFTGYFWQDLHVEYQE